MIEDTQEADELLAELSAAHIAWQLGRIATAQHRVSVLMAGERRERVLHHLKRLGISDAAASAHAMSPFKPGEAEAAVSVLADLRERVCRIEREILGQLLDLPRQNP